MNNRHARATPTHRFVRRIAVLAALAVLHLSGCIQSTETPRARTGKAIERPNIVLIFIDDMGWKDAGYTGSDFYETPVIDRLAREGMVFTNAYAAAGNCAPSRACLISGQYTPRHGVYAVRDTRRGPVSHMRLEPIPNTTSLAPENVTIAEGLKAAGYATAIFGKWHLGDTPETLPDQQGFDVVGASGHKSPKDRASNRIFKQTNDPKHIYEITAGACHFMEQNKHRPFFVYVSHYATHSPIQARKEMFGKFADKPPGKLHSHAKFAAMNAQMDHGVGVLLNKIKELGLEDKTLVLFTSDNGGLPKSPQTPLRGFKGMYYEGGVRVPMIARWPGVIKPGSRCDVPVINVDFYPTFLDVAGAQAPAGKRLDGESLLELFRGEQTLAERPIFWHFPGYLDRPNPGSRDQIFRARPVSVIRQGDWKLHLFHEEWALDGGWGKRATNSSIELYNLVDGISETKNLARANPTKRDALLKKLLAWMKRVKAQSAHQPNPQYDPTKAIEKKKKKKKKKKSSKGRSTGGK